MPKIDSLAPKGEPLYPPPRDVELVSTVRGSVLVLDWVWLREHGHFEAYVEALGNHRALLEVAATQWLPLEDSLAHWRALEALHFSPEVERAIGKFVAERVHNVILTTLIRLAGKMGVTPWTALTHCHRLWQRSWQGGGMSVYCAAEHAARIEVFHNPALAHHHLRNAMRGAIDAAIAPFCQSSVIHELVHERTPTSIVLRASWKL